MSSTSVVTNAGLAILTAMVEGSATPTYMACGTGGGTAAYSDTSMLAEDTTTGRASAVLTRTTTIQTNDTITATAAFSFAPAAETLTELGLFTASTGGTMIAHTSGLSIPVGVSNSLANGKAIININLGESGPALQSVYKNVVLADAPLIYYRFNDLPGASTCTDISGNGNNGTYTGVPNLSTAVSLVGDINDYSFSPYSTGSTGCITAPRSVPSTGPWSLELVTKGANPVGYPRLWADGLYDDTTGLCIACLNTGVAINITFNVTSGSLSNLTAINNFTFWEIHHIVMTWNGTSTLTFYVDGAAIYINAAMTGPYKSSAHNLVIGGDPGSANFNGLYDEFAMYGTCLSPTQVSTHSKAAFILQ